jgi:peroxiredoxin
MTMLQAQNSQNPQISGHLDGIGSNPLILCVTDENLSRTERIDTIAVTDGSFAFNLKEKEVRLIVLTPMPEAGKQLFQTGEYIQTVAVPGENAVITGSFKDYKIGGSDFYQALDVTGKERSEMERQMTERQQYYSGLIQRGCNSDSAKTEFQKDVASIQKRMDDVIMDYIKANPDKDAAAYLTTYLQSGMDEGVALLTDRARNGVMGPYIASLKKRVEAQQMQAEHANAIAEGTMAPDFTLKDINGKDLTLSSLRGKYLVLDFWGSWCHWCIKGMPDMKNAYSKYNKKAEFLGIACNDKEEKWKDAVKKNELPWLQVINDGDVDVSALYGIQGYPTKIVIDPDGKVIKVVEGEDPDFYLYLDTIFR